MIEATDDLAEIDEPARPRELIRKHDDLFAKLNDFWNYCAANRLFLPDSIMGEIRRVLDQSMVVKNATIIFMASPDRNLTLPGGWADDIAETLGLEARGKKIETPALFLRQLTEEMEKQTRKLESLYRSVADITDK
jgi:hypothetical protein